MKKGSVLVIFDSALPKKTLKWWKKFDVVIAPRTLEQEIHERGIDWKSIEEVTEAGNIYQASTFAEELSRLRFPEGTRISKSSSFKDYELWWINYDTLFFYYCLPYTQYKGLLMYLINFQYVHLFNPPYKRLFSTFLEAHGNHDFKVNEFNLRNFFLPVGIFIQMLLTPIFLCLLAFRKPSVLLFTSDEFDGTRDHNFRMRYLYEELRQQNIPFVEFIRSIESWKTVLIHAYKRKRPVVYTDAIAFIARFISIITGGRIRAQRKFGSHRFATITDSDTRFKSFVATQFLLCVYDDIWAIRITKFFLRVINIRSAIILSAMGRNFHTVLGCKLKGIPTVGILHGVASRNYNLYDFMPAFDGVKTLSVDKYGLWSEWWKEYFIKNSRAYRSQQLYVSGPMRPLEGFKVGESVRESSRNFIRVLFVSEVNAVPSEVMPYLTKLISQNDIKVTVKFRSHYDAFEEWLLANKPGLLRGGDIQVVKGAMQDAIHNADVVVGCQSTGVLEALGQLKVPIFFRTGKWGDYYSMGEYNKTQHFFAENPEELIKKINSAHLVSQNLLTELCEQYFGDPYKNGSAWVVSEVKKYL